MSKIKVWNWQKVHNGGASIENWVYGMMMDRRIKVLKDGSVQVNETGKVAKIDDYLVWLRDTDELRAVEKEDFENNYERMT